MHDPSGIDPSVAEELARLRTELAKARQEVSSVEQRWVQMLEQAPLPMYSLDTQGRLRSVSIGWLELLGYCREEVLGVRLSAFVDPGHREKVEWQCSSLLSAGGAGGVEYVALRKGGEPIHVAAEGMAWRDHLSGQQFLRFFVRDISAEKAARDVLSRSERFYRTVFDSAAIPCALARNLLVIYANKAMSDILGLPSPKLLVGKSMLDYVPEEAAPIFIERARRRARGETLENPYEAVVIGRDGQIIPVLATVSMVQLTDGPATLGFFQDISRQKRMEASLIVSEARFRKLFDEVPSIAVQGYDQNRRVVYWNDASEALYGYLREEALGRQLEDLIIPPAMREGVIEAVRAWVEDGVPIPAGELSLMRKEGSLVPVYSSHVLQKSTGGDCELYCLDVDLSELHAAREELTRARDAAQAANNAKSEFLANMSHEIRTPLNGVLGMLQLLLGCELPGEQREYVDLAFEASRRLLGLLNDILDYSRIESRRMSLHPAPMRLRELGQSVLQILGVAAQRRGLRLILAADASCDRIVVADEVRLRQVLLNLVGNAIKFTVTGVVRLEMWLSNDTRAKAAPGGLIARLCVVDTGVGIPPDKIDTVFERFTQTDSSHTRKFEGAGLGLAIVKRLAELMGGQIMVDTEPELGTSICFSLPVLPAELPEIETDADERHSGVGEPLKVLVVEDDRISQMYITQVLGNLGHDCDAASNGQEAAQAAWDAPYDLVLMDIQMPVMDGLEAMRAIRERDLALGRPPTHIVAMTAYAMSGDREKFLGAGMDGYLSKPVQTPDLVDALERADSVRMRRRVGRKQ